MGKKKRKTSVNLIIFTGNTDSMVMKEDARSNLTKELK